MKMLPACLLMLLGSCLSLPNPPKTYEEVFDHTLTERDAYKGTEWVTGPTYDLPFPESWLLRALLTDDGHAETIQLYATLTPSQAWAFYDSAADSFGTRFEVLEIDRTAHAFGAGVLRIEEVAVRIPRQYAEDRRENGLRMKVWGKRDEKVVTVPSYYLAAFLDRIDGQGPMIAANPED